jgi:cobalt-zinc-cadmium resistance protein CzcA
VLASIVCTQAQTYTLDQAIEVAVLNNRSIKSANTEIDYQRSFRKSATDIGKTSVVLMYGQYNSFYQDDNFTVSQTIPFPTALSKQSGFAKSLIKGSEMKLSVTKNELITNVKFAYYQLAFFKAKEKLLREQLSIFENFEMASNIRYKTGEANLLEKATATSQAYEIRTLQLQNADDIKIGENRLQTLLNSNTPISITDTSLLKRISATIAQPWQQIPICD